MEENSDQLLTQCMELFQCRPHVVETVKRGLVQAARLLSHSQDLPAQIDRAGLRLVAILPPIGVDDAFDDVGVKERA